MTFDLRPMGTEQNPHPEPFFSPRSKYQSPHQNSMCGDPRSRIRERVTQTECWLSRPPHRALHQDSKEPLALQSSHAILVASCAPNHTVASAARRFGLEGAGRTADHALGPPAPPPPFPIASDGQHGRVDSCSSSGDLLHLNGPRSRQVPVLCQTEQERGA